MPDLDEHIRQVRCALNHEKPVLRVPEPPHQSAQLLGRQLHVPLTALGQHDHGKHLADADTHHRQAALWIHLWSSPSGSFAVELGRRGSGSDLVLARRSRARGESALLRRTL